jgi:flagellar hook-associated protein 1 FlgK
MAKIHGMMDIGKRAMMNSQTALQTTSHNIANKATEGYSRQRVDLQTAPPVTEGNLLIGTGSRAAAVSRTNNPFLEKQIQKETNSLGSEKGKEMSLNRMQEVFNEQMNKGLNQYITDFFNSFRELSNNPESVTSRTLVKESAEALVEDFRRVDNQLTSIQMDVDERIKNETQEVNKLIQQIADLNEKIASTEIQGMPANDQRDSRDLALKQLNEKIDIKFSEGEQGKVTVTTAGDAILVIGFEHFELNAATNPQTDRVDVFYKSKTSGLGQRITDRIKGGTMGGSLAIRDQVIPDFKEKMDEMAFLMSYEINKAHVEGYDRAGNPAELFFNNLTQVSGAAKNMKVNENILDDVNMIAAGARPGAVGDNTVANVISQLQYKELMDGGHSTIDDYYNSQVGRIGVLAQKAVKARESQANVLNQLSNIRESISGVSLDEETTKMIEFQRAFDASARVIRTADEMFETVLALKRI